MKFSKIEIEDMNPELFTYEKYVSAFGDALNLSYSVFSRTPEGCDMELILALRKYAVGWCKADRLTVRPREKLFVAIMCEKDGERFWFHIMESTKDIIIGELEMKENKR